MKSSGVAYLLWLPSLIGICGLHRFYLDRPGSGLLMLFTCGACGIWNLIDLFLIPDMVMSANQFGYGGIHVNVVNKATSSSGRRRRDDDD